MTMETARTLLEQVFSLMGSGSDVTFSFRGGEPTLAGLRFYQAFTELAEQMCPSGCHLFWAIQTNGLNLDDHWIDLFVQHDFEVSVSVDGYEALHDENRGAGSWKRVRDLFRRLRERDVVVDALCTITKQSSRRPEMIYQSLRKLGANNITFRPCMDAGGKKNAWSLTPPHLANFLCRVFDVWYEDWENGKYCFVNLFDDYIRLIRGSGCADCSRRGMCGGTVVIDADGSIYPCEKYAFPEDCIGTVGKDGLGAALTGRKYQAFLQSGNRKPAECLECSRRALCGGGCKYDWVTDQKGVHNPYCSAYKRFFLYAFPRLHQIAQNTKET